MVNKADAIDSAATQLRAIATDATTLAEGYAQRLAALGEAMHLASAAIATLPIDVARDVASGVAKDCTPHVFLDSARINRNDSSYTSEVIGLGVGWDADESSFCGHVRYMCGQHTSTTSEVNADTLLALIKDHPPMLDAFEECVGQIAANFKSAITEQRVATGK
jgi:hypothetical protein